MERTINFLETKSSEQWLVCKTVLTDDGERYIAVVKMLESEEKAIQYANNNTTINTRYFILPITYFSKSSKSSSNE